ncbi:MAG: GNAT family N-acetyltransferase, partial [Caldilineaceae bacterium]|nr:GNAT family N-acetyltransferase [Caldilineaceae bacterium]
MFSEASTAEQPKVFQQLTTERTVTRRFTLADVPALHAIRTDPTVARFQSWDGTSEESIQRFIQSLQGIAPGTPGEWFQFAIASRATNELMGDCGLHVLAEDPRLGEIGYTLAQRFQGQGYATEAVSAILDYTFTTLKLHRLAAIVDVRNRGSIKLLERLGFRREGMTRGAFWNKGEWVDEYLYALLQSEWLNRPPTQLNTQVILLGTGTPNPDPDRHGAAVAIVARSAMREQAYLVDCGPGIVRRAAAAAQ